MTTLSVEQLEIDQKAFADVAGGDDATIAVASNGRETPSMQKVIKDQMLFKAPVLWAGSVLVTDFLQTYESGVDGFIYAPAPGKTPFTASVDPSTDAVNFYLFQGLSGYVNGSGVDLDMSGGDVINAANLPNGNQDLISFTVEVADAPSGGNVATGSFDGYESWIGDNIILDIKLVNIDTTGLTPGNILYVLGFTHSSNALIGSLGSMRCDVVTFDEMIVPEIGVNSSAFFFRNIRSGTTDAQIKVQDISSGVTDMGITLNFTK